MSALLRPLGGSRFLVVLKPFIVVHRQTRKILAGLELGEDLPCLTVDDDEWLQGAELWGDRGTMAARVPAG